MQLAGKHISLKGIFSSAANFLNEKFVVEQCRNWFSYSLLLGICLFAGIISVIGGIKYGLLFVIAMAVIPFTIAFIVNAEFGILALLTISYVLFYIMRLGISFPLGTLMDALHVLLLIGMLIRIKKEKNTKILRGAGSVMVIVWIGYNLLALFNPEAASRMAWLYTVRSMAFVMMLYFVFLYQIRSAAFIRKFLKLWLFLALVGSLYAINQEYRGFSSHELAYLSSDPRITELYFIDGHWRKFSIFSDPMVYAFNMAIASILCISLIAMPFVRPMRKIVLAIGAVLFFVTMLYSGTRSAYVLVPAALVLLAIFRYNRITLIVSAIAGVCALILIYMPTDEPLLLRFQTAFRPSEDASFNVRKINQRLIQPYLQSHPLGGGLGSTGVWGQRFSPNTFLANFPPDSGYVRVAVELGWVGLLIFCSMMFVFLRTGINNYYLIKDPELKSYCMAMVLVLFALNIANYPQEALVQFPTSILFVMAAATVQVCYRLDREKQNVNFYQTSNKS